MTPRVPFSIFTTILMNLLLDTQIQPSFDRWTSLFLVAAVQGLFLSFMLYRHRKGNRRANRILSLIIGNCASGFHNFRSTQYSMF